MVQYLIIFFAKILEVSLMTIRTVLITRGEKLFGSIIGFVEVVLWLYLINTVLIGINEDPIRMIIYSLGFASGNYIGSILEEKLALGLVTINVIVNEEYAEYVVKNLRDMDIGVTVINAEGINDFKKVLILFIKRKRKNEVIRVIESMNKNCVISINDTKAVYGAYGIRK